MEYTLRSYGRVFLLTFGDFMLRSAAFALTFIFFQQATANELPIFDAHIHYSHDAVKLVPPADAIKALRSAGLRKALVSSSDDNGTQLLFEAAPPLPGKQESNGYSALRQH